MYEIIIIIIIIIIIVSFKQGIHTHIPEKTMFLRDTLLQLFCLCCLWYLYFQFLRWLFCSFTLALSEICVQCPI